jgi:hypothetical protein
MKCIQNICYTQSWITPLQRETVSFFSPPLYITFSVNVSVGSCGGVTNLQMILDLIPCCLKHVYCYHSYDIPYVGFQALKVIDLNLVDSVIHITPQEKSSGVKSGDLEGQAIGPPLLSDLPAVFLSGQFLTWWQKCGSACM